MATAIAAAGVLLSTAQAGSAEAGIPCLDNTAHAPVPLADETGAAKLVLKFPEEADGALVRLATFGQGQEESVSAPTTVIDGEASLPLLLSNQELFAVTDYRFLIEFPGASDCVEAGTIVAYPDVTDHVAALGSMRSPTPAELEDLAPSEAREGIETLIRTAVEAYAATGGNPTSSEEVCGKTPTVCFLRDELLAIAASGANLPDEATTLVAQTLDEATTGEASDPNGLCETIALDPTTPNVHSPVKNERYGSGGFGSYESTPSYEMPLMKVYQGLTRSGGLIGAETVLRVGFFIDISVPDSGTLTVEARSSMVGDWEGFYSIYFPQITGNIDAFSDVTHSIETKLDGGSNKYFDTYAPRPGRLNDLPGGGATGSGTWSNSASKDGIKYSLSRGDHTLLVAGHLRVNTEIDAGYDGFGTMRTDFEQGGYGLSIDRAWLSSSTGWQYDTYRKSRFITCVRYYV